MSTFEKITLARIEKMREEFGSFQTMLLEMKEAMKEFPQSMQPVIATYFVEADQVLLRLSIRFDQWYGSVAGIIQLNFFTKEQKQKRLTDIVEHCTKNITIDFMEFRFILDNLMEWAERALRYGDE